MMDEVKISVKTMMFCGNFWILKVFLLLSFTCENVYCFLSHPQFLRSTPSLYTEAIGKDKKSSGSLKNAMNNDFDYINSRNVRVNGINIPNPSGDEIIKDIKVSRIGNRVLNPSQVLYPSYFPFFEKYEDGSAKYSIQSAIEDGSVDAIPLERALAELKKSMEKIVGFQSQIERNGRINFDTVEEIEFMLGSNLRGDKSDIFDYVNQEIPKQKNEKYFILRIEQPLSHPVDPLCWLHANLRKPPLFMKKNEKDPEIIYLADAEGTVEAAAFGSSHMIHDLMKQGGEEYNGENHGPHNAWDIIRNLPETCRVYGGSRFDQNLQPDLRGDEWVDFGNEKWILPAIELRQENSIVEENLEEHNTSGNGNRKMSQTTLSTNLYFTSLESLIQSAENILHLLNRVTHQISPPVPYTTLPPILSRGFNDDAQEEFERAVDSALEMFNNDTEYSAELFQKVVLARRNDLYFGTEVYGLDLMMKLKFGGNIGGHLFYMNPGQSIGKEFLGCAPERLFQVRGLEKKVISEALAGTRPRGSTSLEDKELLNDLILSEKDRSENTITGEFIKKAFERLHDMGLIEDEEKDNTQFGDNFFVRRLQHLQHICQSFQGEMKSEEFSVDVIRILLNELHPTPAVCGAPSLTALQFIRNYETPCFDRGLYAGPFGYIGKYTSDIIVAIRSGLLSRNNHDTSKSSKLSIFAGAGVVPGSTVQGEWSEIGYKLGVLSSFFSQSPLTLKSFGTPNEAWATAFVEELVRSGITQFYICPGSRSTPMTTALSRAMRMHVGVVECISVHDERAAAFRAVGYGRATRRTAAVVTSSGTAVANLYPAVVEASMDGIPLLLLTADRPYETRDVGANQSIDQLKIFSNSYVRWFRDVLPPSDDVSVSLALSDANHAATVAQEMLGPVHLNIQFRENLAPESGKIRGDNRVQSTTSFSSNRFVDAPGFTRWSENGLRWTNSYKPESLCENLYQDLSSLIIQSKRGIIVVGNLRDANAIGGTSHSRIISAMISEFASFVGFPIFAGSQSADLRFSSAAVVPFAELLFKNPTIKANLSPDLVIQIGSSLISTEIQDLIYRSSNDNVAFSHVLLHPHKPSERHDPSGTLTHKISADLASFIPNLRRHLEKVASDSGPLSSQLSPLVNIGREISKQIPSIVQSAVTTVKDEHARVWNEQKPNDHISLSEPEIILALRDHFCHINPNTQSDLFLSNSMPVRDAEFFLYPSYEHFDSDDFQNHSLGSVAVNRGASGIDGIISSATGHIEGTSVPTTLLIGDLATLHDLNAFHHISDKKQLLPLTIVVVNNDGGGIFSFLPIAKFRDEVGFEEFFGTPTSSFSFAKGSEAFGLQFKQASSFEEFKDVYMKSSQCIQPTIIEAKVVGREENVQIHKVINQIVSDTIDSIIESDCNLESWVSQPTLSAKLYSIDEINKSYSSNQSEPIHQVTTAEKTLVLLHGWMGDKNEWDDVANCLMDTLPTNWNIISLDLPGHGNTDLFNSSNQVYRKMLKLDDTKPNTLSIESMAKSVLRSLSQEYGVETVDAIAGYSLGGRVALSMKKISSSESYQNKTLILDDTQIFLLGSFPGVLQKDLDLVQTSAERVTRKMKDDLLADTMNKIHLKSLLSSRNELTRKKFWMHFLKKWYSNSSLWSDLQQTQRIPYQKMIQRRLNSLSYRALDLADVLQMCSPARNVDDDWKFISPEGTIFMAGENDTKYAQIGKKWAQIEPSLTYYEIKNSGHALLIEAPDQVSEYILNSLTNVRGISKLRAEPLHVSNSTMTPIDNMSKTKVRPAILEMEHFTVAMSENKSGNDLKGIGWGDGVKNLEHVNQREGYIISVSSHDGRFVGIGEVSPLSGVHSETIEDVKHQLEAIQIAFSKSNIPDMNCERILALDGSMNAYIDSMIQTLSLDHLQSGGLYPSVMAGFEMLFMSLASEATKSPLPRSLLAHIPFETRENLLPINGLITRGEKIIADEEENIDGPISYPSIKIKVGHLDPPLDAQNVINTQRKYPDINVRADANRSWNESSAIDFAERILEFDVINHLEFVEEPLHKIILNNDDWDISIQVAALERWHEQTGIKYALDESVADIVKMSKGENFEVISEKFRSSLSGTSGCAAIVLKPTVLGMELSLRLARMVHEDLGIGAVFTSTFESGIGLAFTSFIAFTSDSYANKDGRYGKTYPHGISTFSLLDADTLSPKFESYVKDDGRINIMSLGRAIYGLSLDEIRESFFTIEEVEFEKKAEISATNTYQATSLTSESGRELSIQASLPLPFSDDVACSRFADLPQQPRWSPWLKSVSYLGNAETEWTLNVRGVEFQWKAVSKSLESPKGIIWESISGLKNKGRVEFTKVSETSCLMTVKMSIITPRIVALVFRTTGEMVKEFVESKLLKWSLESFRDVVKADLALERGEAELGDALYGAVEGRSNAIEATLSRIGDLN